MLLPTQSLRHFSFCVVMHRSASLLLLYIHSFCLTISYLYNRCPFVGHPNHPYPCTFHFWETTATIVTILTILSTLHTNISTFVFKVFPVKASTCPTLSHYWMHLRNSTFALLYSITCHSTSIPAIFISVNRKKSLGARPCKGVVEPPPCTLILKFVEKKKPCDLAPCCNAERSNFMQFLQSFLPSKTTFKGLRTPQVEQLWDTDIVCMFFAFVGQI